MRSAITFMGACCIVGLLATSVAAGPAVSLWVVRVNNDPFLDNPVTAIDAVPGDFLWVELRVRDWSPGGEKLRAYQLGIDYNSYFTGTAGNVLPFHFEDTTDQNGLCSGGPQGTENQYGMAMNVNHADFVFLNLSPLNTAINTLSSCDYKIMAALTDGEIGPISDNNGDWSFCGYLFLVVSDDAAGTFEVAYQSHPDLTRLADPNNEDILPLQRDPLIIRTPGGIGACCQSGPACDEMTVGECDGIAGEYMGDETPCPLNPADLCEPPSEVPFAESAPACNDTLPRYQNNVIRLTFGGDITAPSAGQVPIQEALDNGNFGIDDYSGSFTFAVEDDGGGNPRILKITENGGQLPGGGWYSFYNSGGWGGVAAFEVKYPVVYGDADNDGTTDSLDVTDIWGNRGTGAPDDSRYDIDGNGSVGALDVSDAWGNRGSTAPGEPTMHACP